MSTTWGRLTVYGSSKLESRLTELLNEVQEVCVPLLGSNSCRAMVLFGGYGRGEGGVEIIEENGHQNEKPHNNLDFLIITQPGCPESPEHIKSAIYETLKPLRDKYQIEMDLAVIGAAKLCREPSLVMWYDMRFGHKCILGDVSFLQSLSRFSVDNIPAWDVWNLLVNRGTLLIINDYLLANPSATFDARKTVVKHAMKAIIGYGDALLYLLGGYNWSYQEKQRRMRDTRDVPQAYRALYDEAIEFRFRPRYAQYVDRDLRAWMDELRAVFEPIYLQCEAVRLCRKDITWGNYAAAALSHAFLQDPKSVKGWAKKGYRMALRRGRCAGGSVLSRLGYQSLGPRGRMAFAFPCVAFNTDTGQMHRIAAAALGASSCDINELRRAYLLAWNRYGDTNFGSFLRNCSIDLESKRQPA